MKIFTISGLDGSGKSTQIEKLSEYLEAQGKKVFYFHAIEFGIAKKISKKKNDEAKSVTKASAFKIWLRKAFLIIDLWRFRKLLAKLVKERYDYLVSDRYFYDSVININFLSSKNNFDLAKNIIKPEVAIYLSASPEVIMQRERKPDQGLEYLEKKERLYGEAAKDWEMNVVNGNRSKEEIFDEIKNLLS